MLVVMNSHLAYSLKRGDPRIRAPNEPKAYPRATLITVYFAGSETHWHNTLQIVPVEDAKQCPHGVNLSQHGSANGPVDKIPNYS